MTSVKPETVATIEQADTKEILQWSDSIVDTFCLRSRNLLEDKTAKVTVRDYPKSVNLQGNAAILYGNRRSYLVNVPNAIMAQQDVPNNIEGLQNPTVVEFNFMNTLMNTFKLYEGNGEFKQPATDEVVGRIYDSIDKMHPGLKKLLLEVYKSKDEFLQFCKEDLITIKEQGTKTKVIRQGILNQSLQLQSFLSDSDANPQNSEEFFSNVLISADLHDYRREYLLDLFRYDRAGLNYKGIKSVDGNVVGYTAEIEIEGVKASFEMEGSTARVFWVKSSDADLDVNIPEVKRRIAQALASVCEDENITELEFPEGIMTQDEANAIYGDEAVQLVEDTTVTEETAKGKLLINIEKANGKEEVIYRTESIVFLKKKIRLEDLLRQIEEGKDPEAIKTKLTELYELAPKFEKGKERENGFSPHDPVEDLGNIYLKTLVKAHASRQNLPEDVARELFIFSSARVDELGPRIFPLIYAHRLNESISEMVFRSDAIEDQTKTLMQYSKNEHKELLRQGWESAIGYLDQLGERDITLEDIKNVHHRIYFGLIPEFLTGIEPRRDYNVTFGDNKTSGYVGEKVRKGAEEFLARLNNLKRLIRNPGLLGNPLSGIRASNAYMDFIRIHPLVDGNATTGLALTQHILHPDSAELREYIPNMNTRILTIFRYNLISCAGIYLTAKSL